MEGTEIHLKFSLVTSGSVYIDINKEKFFPFKLDLQQRPSITVFLNLKHSEILAQWEHLLLLNMIEQLGKEEGSLS